MWQPHDIRKLDTYVAYQLKISPLLIPALLHEMVSFHSAIIFIWFVVWTRTEQHVTASDFYCNESHLSFTVHLSFFFFFVAWKVVSPLCVCAPLIFLRCFFFFIRLIFNFYLWQKKSTFSSLFTTEHIMKIVS